MLKQGNINPDDEYHPFQEAVSDAPDNISDDRSCREYDGNCNCNE